MTHGAKQVEKNTDFFLSPMQFRNGDKWCQNYWCYSPFTTIIPLKMLSFSFILSIFDFTNSSSMYKLFFCAYFVKKKQKKTCVYYN